VTDRQKRKRLLSLYVIPISVMVYCVPEQIARHFKVCLSVVFVFFPLQQSLHFKAECRHVRGGTNFQSITK
jgi:hypothetical protein